MLDPSEFIDPDLPGYKVSTTPSIEVIFSRQYVDTQNIAGVQPIFTIVEDDAPANGTNITIDGTVYTIRVIQPDGEGFASLILEQN